jgi:hypothetical protein
MSFDDSETSGNHFQSELSIGGLVPQPFSLACTSTVFLEVLNSTPKQVRKIKHQFAVTTHS